MSWVRPWLIVGGFLTPACECTTFGLDPDSAKGGSSSSTGSFGSTSSAAATTTAGSSSTDAAETTGTSSPVGETTGNTTTGGPSTGATGEASTGTTSAASASSTSSTGDMGEPLPDVPVLQVSFSQVRRFHFTWSPAGGAQFYQLRWRSDLNAALGPISAEAENIVGESITLTMPLHLRFGARYVLRACNDGGCTDSAELEITDSLADAIGYFKASNGNPMDNFGYSVALSADGSVLAIGANLEDGNGVGGTANNSATNAGAVYVYTRTGDSWAQQPAYIKASNAEGGDQFGLAIALSGDGNTLAVGAFHEDSNGPNKLNGLMDSGAVYVYTRVNNTWTEQAYVKASSPGLDDGFGHNVSLSGDGNTLAVGAPYRGANDSGAAYVFRRTNNVWTQQAYLTAPNPGTGDRLGQGVSLSEDGDTLAVGAPFEDGDAVGVGGTPNDSPQGTDSGAVYVYVFSAGEWKHQAYIKASNTGPGDNFGLTAVLSGDGNTLAVGASLEDSAAKGIGGDTTSEASTNAGAVYVYVRAGDVWQPMPTYIKASNTGAGDYFGQNLALAADGTTLVVGAKFEDSMAPGVGGDQDMNVNLGDFGAVYVFERKKDVWSQRAYVKAGNPGMKDQFGFSLALSATGDTLAAGAYFEDSSAKNQGGNQFADLNDMQDYGAVYLY